MTELFEGYFDGSATPNPGQMKIGGFIRRVSDKVEVHSYSIDLGYGTNNEAEYSSLIELCENLKPLGVEKINIYGDSQLVVNQVNGLWQARDKRMQVFKSNVLQLLSSVPDWTLQHVRRGMNMEADSLTR
jgi:ribonuclease HI